MEKPSGYTLLQLSMHTASESLRMFHHAMSHVALRYQFISNQIVSSVHQDLYRAELIRQISNDSLVKSSTKPMLARACTFSCFFPLFSMPSRQNVSPPTIFPPSFLLPLRGWLPQPTPHPSDQLINRHPLHMQAVQKSVLDRDEQ